MDLKQKLRADSIECLRNKNVKKRAILSVVLGEIDTAEKMTNGSSATDGEVILILRKLEKNLMLAGTPDSLAELTLIKEYLPDLMGEEEIRVILGGYKSDGIKNSGAMMGAFNKNHKGLADNILVSMIAKEMFS